MDESTSPPEPDRRGGIRCDPDPADIRVGDRGGPLTAAEVFALIPKEVGS